MITWIAKRAHTTSALAQLHLTVVDGFRLVPSGLQHSTRAVLLIVQARGLI